MNIFENFNNAGTKSNNSLLNNYFEKKNEIKKYKNLYIKCLVIALSTNVFQYLCTIQKEEATNTQVLRTKKSKVEVEKPLIPTNYHKIKIKLNTKFIATVEELTLVKIAHPKTKNIISRAYIVEKDPELNETIIAVPNILVGNYIQFSDLELIAIPLNSNITKRRGSNEINI